MKKNLLWIMLLVMAACGGNAAVGKGGDVETAIRERLTAIYASAQNNDELFDNDHLYMSQDYNRLQDSALKKAEPTQDIVIDADHWVMGQDVQDPSMRIEKVTIVDDTHATAQVIITNMGTDTPVTLQLIHERGDWYIDNMQIPFEGEVLDEKQGLIDYLNQ